MRSTSLCGRVRSGGCADHRVGPARCQLDLRRIGEPPRAVLSFAPPRDRGGKMLAMPSLVRPRRLSPGSTVGLVAPSSAPNEPEDIRFAIATLESLGFRVRPGPHLFAREGYLAGA